MLVMFSDSICLGMALGIPFAGALLIACFDRHPNVRETITLVCSGTLFLTVFSLLETVELGARPSLLMVQTLPGVALVLTAEPLGLLFALLASFLWIVTSVYSIGYMRGCDENNQTRFYVCFAIALVGVMGVAFAGNLFTLFLFYELLTLSTYPLVTHAGTPAAKRAGRTYLGILLGTSIGLQLVAIVWTWTLAGTVDFTPGGLLRDKASPAVMSALCLLFILGVGKAALMPFHRWLPAAMVAPTPVSALLHAVAVVKAGVFTILKVVIYIFGVNVLSEVRASEWIAYLAAFTIIAGSIVAMRQNNLKARLAYSTVSQLAYIVLGAMLASSVAVIGAGMHIVMHAFGKIMLFFCAGAIMVATQKTKVSEMDGLGRVMPVTMTAFLVGSLCVIGLPPGGGMWSKWYLAAGTLESGQLLLLAVFMLSSLLSIAYLLPIPIRAFFGRARVDSQITAVRIREAPFACMLAIVVTGVGCVWLFVNPQPIYALMLQAVSL